MVEMLNRWESMTAIKLSSSLREKIEIGAQVKVRRSDIKEISSRYALSFHFLKPYRVSYMDIVNFSKAAAISLEVQRGTCWGVQEEWKMLRTSMIWLSFM